MLDLDVSNWYFGSDRRAVSRWDALLPVWRVQSDDCAISGERERRVRT